MIIEKIGVGASIQEAYEDAKAQLNAPEEACLQQEIIQDAKKRGLFRKAEPAKVKVWYEVADPVPAKPQVKETKAEKAAPKKESEKKAAKPEKKAPVAPAKKEIKEEIKETVTEAQETKVTLPIEENDVAANYLKAIVAGIGIENFTMTLEKTEEQEYIYSVSCGDEDGALIGRRGETLDSIQYLLRLSVNRGKDEANHRKVSVNVGNYREKRNENLRALAARSAKQVLKYGRNAVLEPMNPYERRIIHTAIQGIEGVTSHSVGYDNERKVVISLEEGVTPTNPSKGGYNNRRGGNNNRRGGGKPYQKKEAYKPAQTREPRKDNAGSLYGKIEIPSKAED